MLVHPARLRTVPGTTTPATRMLQSAPELRERDFGALDGGSDAHYLPEWSRDAEDPSYRAGGAGRVAGGLRGGQGGQATLARG